jgi:hypothetical protein
LGRMLTSGTERSSASIMLLAWLRSASVAK